MIAAKLNIANGAALPQEVASAIADAHGLLEGLVIPPVGDDHLQKRETGDIEDVLQDYNTGMLEDGPAHCGGP